MIGPDQGIAALVISSCQGIANRAICAAMTIAIQKTLDKYGVRRVAAAAGIPFWTLRKWYDADKIPGEGVAQEMRAEMLARALRKLKPLPKDMRRAKKPRAA